MLNIKYFSYIKENEETIKLFTGYSFPILYNIGKSYDKITNNIVECKLSKDIKIFDAKSKYDIDELKEYCEKFNINNEYGIILQNLDLITYDNFTYINNIYNVSIFKKILSIIKKIGYDGFIHTKLNSTAFEKLRSIIPLSHIDKKAYKNAHLKSVELFKESKNKIIKIQKPNLIKYPYFKDLCDYEKHRIEKNYIAIFFENCIINKYIDFPTLDLKSTDLNPIDFHSQFFSSILFTYDEVIDFILKLNQEDLYNYLKKYAPNTNTKKEIEQYTEWFNDKYVSPYFM